MINFTKMHGLGNDYICINALDERNKIKSIEEFVKNICDRHFGIGADGVILIKKSNIADLKMEIYNLDGSQAQMCGNGIRCFSKYAYDNEILRKSEFDVETLAGIKHIVLDIENGIAEEVTVNMGKAIWKDETIPKECNIEEKNSLTLQIDDLEITGTAVSMGNPHFVIISKDIEKINLEKYGDLIEHHPIFPEKTNVEFIEVKDDTNIKMIVWERGCGETFACGTGACAAFAVCNNLGLVKDSANVHLKGGTLNIKINENTKEIFMRGPATKVFEGQIEQ